MKPKKQQQQPNTQVSTEEGKHLATQFGCPFYETSAALRHYIDDAFYTLIREIRRKENQQVIISPTFFFIMICLFVLMFNSNLVDCFFFVCVPNSPATVRVRRRLIQVVVVDGGEFDRFLLLFSVAGDETKCQHDA